MAARRRTKLSANGLKSAGRCSRRQHNGAARAELSKAAGSTSPCFSRLSRRVWSCSMPQPDLATLITGTFSAPVSPPLAATERFSCRQRCGPEEDQGVGVCIALRGNPLLPAAICRRLSPSVRRIENAWPSSNLSWKSASPRDVNRSRAAAAVRTGTGTASSMAALIVHRLFARVRHAAGEFRQRGVFGYAPAVKSSNHEDHVAAAPNLRDVRRLRSN